MRRLAVPCLLSAVLAASGSGCSDDAPACIEVSVEDCQPLYEPTFDNVYERTLAPSCGVAGSQCHAREGARGGLVFADVDEAHALLTDGRRVIPGDAQCSELAVRIESTGALQMPPQTRLPEAERCSILQWIANGAER